MDGDDDMIVIIVGDDENEDNQSNVMPLALAPTIPIKEEPANDHDGSVLNTESILETAELYGEYVNLIKEEYYDCEYLDDDFDKEKEPFKSEPIRGLKIKVENSGVVSPDDDSDDEHPDSQSKPRLSYIDQLRKNFPKMRKDEEYLVAHLTEIMKNTKPPIPPIDFCTNVEDTLVCAYCGIVSETLPIACRHYQKRHGSRYLVCYACGLNYRCTTGLYKHEKRCPAPSAALVLRARGRYLGRKGRKRPYLTLNKFQPWDKTNIEQVKKRHYCSQCTASFSHKDALKSHEYMHQGIRPYKCDQCPTAYTSALALRRHLVNHTDAQCICDVCGRSFKAKTTLIVHMNTHLPQRKYPCHRCDRRFAQKSALQHHVNRDHLHIPPPLACAACPKRFPRISNLKAHMMAKHGLTLMTRKMFFKALPSMKESEVKKATVVFNQMDDVDTPPFGETLFNKKIKFVSIDDKEAPSIQDVEADPVTRSPSASKVVSETLPDNNKLDSDLETEIVQHTLHKDNLPKDKQTIDTPDNEVENVPPAKSAVVRTSLLNERCELEFVKFISKKDKHEIKDKESTSLKDLNTAAMHTDNAITGKSMPLIADFDYENDINEGKSKENVNCKTVYAPETINNKKKDSVEISSVQEVLTKQIANEILTKVNIDRREVCSDANVVELGSNTNGINADKTIVTNENATDIKVDCKKVLKAPAKTKTNLYKKVPMQTRSGVMKTRATIKNERMKKIHI